MDNYVIELNLVNFYYRGEQILKDVSFKVKDGEFLALIGPNGGGKTTIVKLILGLLEPDKGKIRVKGALPNKISHIIGYVPQHPDFKKNFPIRVIDVVLMGLRGPKIGRSVWKAKHIEAAEKILEQIKISEYRNKNIGELSGGQRQKVFIARALVCNPQIIVLDEPVSYIDQKGQTEFYDLLRRLNEKATIVMVSHDFMTLSSFVKSVACVNKTVYYHSHPEITEDMVEHMYHCPVDIVAHGLPHRVLKKH